MQDYLSELENFSLIIYSNGQKFSHTERGVKPLLNAIKDNSLFNSTVIDKVTGKAGAFLLAYAKVEKLYTKVLSLPAKEVLEKHKIPYYAASLVTNVLNRNQNGICPMEELTLNINNCELAYKILDERVNSRTIDKSN